MNPPAVRVFAHHVEVGTLPAVEYHRFRAEAKKDQRLYWAQALNYGQVLLRLFAHMLYLTPVVWFWCLVAVAGYDPAGFATLLARLGSDPVATAAAVALSLRSALLVAVFLRLAAGLIAGGRWPGLVNVVEEAVQQRIRQALKLPVDLALTVIPSALDPSEYERDPRRPR